MDRYVHEGVTYQEPLPRIILFNFASSIGEALKKHTHNVSPLLVAGESPQGYFKCPKPPEEIDILLVNDAGSFVLPGIEKDKALLPGQNKFSGTLLLRSGFPIPLGEVEKKLLLAVESVRFLLEQQTSEYTSIAA